MNKLFGSALVALATSVAGAAVPSTENATWFDENYTGFTEKSTTVWQTSAGKWSKASTLDLSTYDSANARINLRTGGTQLAFAAANYTAYNSCVKYSAKMAMTAYESREEIDADMGSTSPLGALSMLHLSSGTNVFVARITSRDSANIAYRWVELHAEDLENPLAETEYDFEITVDYSCVPTRIRYAVNDSPLKDALGTEWFTLRNGSLDPSVTSQKRPPAGSSATLAFVGRGTVGEIVSQVTTNLAARADVAFGEVSRPKSGSVLTPSVTAREGESVGGELTYYWYRLDASGRRLDTRLADTATYSPTASDYGYWIAVDVSDESGYAGTGKIWFSDLPVCYIDVEDNAWPSSKKEDHACRIRIVGNAEYKDQYTNDAADEFPSTIHVRGNSTSTQDKKPYKIKLGKKTNLFGLNKILDEDGKEIKSKHWVLLANVFDESLMRNKICYDLSEELGVPVSMKSEWVDVVMNGQFVGNYLVCQQIRVAEERVNIYDWSDAASTIAEKSVEAFPPLTNEVLTADAAIGEIEDLLETNCLWMTSAEFTYRGTNFWVTSDKSKKDKQGFNPELGKVVVYWKSISTDITGGYIFENDGGKTKKTDDPSMSVFTNRTALGAIETCLVMNTPEYAFSNPQVLDFVTNYWFEMNACWVSGTGYNAQGKHYTDYADFDSMVAYWLSNYIPGNNDAAWKSRYSFMDQQGKLYFGPTWDCDWGVGSLQVRTTTTTSADGIVTYTPAVATAWQPYNSQQNAPGFWTGDPYFCYCLRERYFATRAYLEGIVKDGGLIDQYKAKLANSARANDIRWNNRIGFFGNAQEKGDVESLRDYFIERFAWLDQQFATVGKAVDSALATVQAKALRFTRNTALAAKLDGATAVAGSIETDVTNVTAALKAAPVTGTVAVPVNNATEVEFYVNGISRGTAKVTEGVAPISIAASAFETGRTNLLTIVVHNAQTNTLCRNVAMLTCTLPADLADEPAAAKVTISWLDGAYAELAEAYPAAVPLPPPSTYAEYLNFATNASPSGKMVGGVAVPLVYDWVAGTDVTNATDVFTVNITIGSDGLPDVTWSPETCKYGTRSYTMYGTPKLDAPGWDTADALNPGDDFLGTNNFFKVEVKVP